VLPALDRPEDTGDKIQAELIEGKELVGRFEKLLRNRFFSVKE